MLVVLPTFLFFVSLSVTAIPLGGQTPHIRSDLVPGSLSNPTEITNLLQPAQLLEKLPIPKTELIGRFIMGADYASSPGPFFGKSSHKRQNPLSGPLSSTADDLHIPPNLSSGPAPP